MDAFTFQYVLPWYNWLFFLVLTVFFGWIYVSLSCCRFVYDLYQLLLLLLLLLFYDWCLGFDGTAIGLLSGWGIENMVDNLNMTMGLIVKSTIQLHPNQISTKSIS